MQFWKRKRLEETILSVKVKKEKLFPPNNSSGIRNWNVLNCPNLMPFSSLFHRIIKNSCYSKNYRKHSTFSSFSPASVSWLAYLLFLSLVRLHLPLFLPLSPSPHLIYYFPVSVHLRTRHNLLFHYQSIILTITTILAPNQ